MSPQRVVGVGRPDAHLRHRKEGLVRKGGSTGRVRPRPRSRTGTPRREIGPGRPYDSVEFGVEPEASEQRDVPQRFEYLPPQLLLQIDDPRLPSSNVTSLGSRRYSARQSLGIIALLQRTIFFNEPAQASSRPSTRPITASHSKTRSLARLGSPAFTAPPGWQRRPTQDPSPVRSRPRGWRREPRHSATVMDVLGPGRRRPARAPAGTSSSTVERGSHRRGSVSRHRPPAHPKVLEGPARRPSCSVVPAGLFQQSLEHPVRRVAVELDVDLRPEVVGQVVQGAPGGDRHQ